MSKKSEVEIIKEQSSYLKGTLQESLENEVTGSLFSNDSHLIKFHGSYVQSDRELDKERKAQKLEPLYSFMIRVRVPGGVATPEQWLALDELATQFGMPSLKLTTRQAFELHEIMKYNLKKTIQGINKTMLDTIAACGDVNRNVMSTVNPNTSYIFEEVQNTAKALSDHLTPHTTAYYQIWLNDEKIDSAGDEAEEETMEPIYGKTYLPRKFKIALAIPPYNDTDVFAHDIGLIAIEEKGKLLGFNVSIGGGMGMTFGDESTYPRLGNIIGFAPLETIVNVCEKIVTVQRDFGNRENRRNARFKYTIDTLGLEVVKAELENRLGFNFLPAKPYTFITNGDSFGWFQAANGNWFCTLFIEGGRVKDFEGYPLRKGLREIAKIHKGDFRLTANQNLVLGNIQPDDKPAIETLLHNYGITARLETSLLRKHSLACVALNLCPLANSEAERYLPQLLDKLEEILLKYHLQEQPITIRMTGCPNGCARPYLGEIGFVGRAPGKYNLYLGAALNGERLNVLYKEAIDETSILEILDPLLKNYSEKRMPEETFGNFLIRTGVVVPENSFLDFHKVKNNT